MISNNCRELQKKIASISKHVNLSVFVYYLFSSIAQDVTFNQIFLNTSTPYLQMKCLLEFATVLKSHINFNVHTSERFTKMNIINKTYAQRLPFISNMSKLQVLIQITVQHCTLIGYLKDSYLSIFNIMLIMELKLNVIIAFLLVCCSSCRNFYATSTLQSTAFYNCIKGLSKQVGILLEQYNNGFNSSSVQNVINAKNGGLSVEGLFIPCRSKSVEQQVDIIFKMFGFHTIQRYWLYPASTYDSECDWTNYEAQENCQYLKDLIAQMKSRGLLNVEIAAQREEWTQVFDTETGCPDVSQSLLWWIPTEKQDDGKPNFNNYKQIGGWEKPYMKPYSSGKLCGGMLYANYYQ